MLSAYIEAKGFSFFKISRRICNQLIYNNRNSECEECGNYKNYHPLWSETMKNNGYFLKLPKLKLKGL